MAKVILKNPWFAPGGRLFRKSVTKKGPPVDIPDDLLTDAKGKSMLPSTAKIVPDDYVTPMKQKSADTLSEHRKMLDAGDTQRRAMEEEGAIRAQAEFDAAKAKAEVEAEAQAKADAETKDTDVEAEMKKAAFQKQLDADAEKSKKGKK